MVKSKAVRHSPYMPELLTLRHGVRAGLWRAVFLIRCMDMNLIDACPDYRGIDVLISDRHV